MSATVATAALLPARASAGFAPGVRFYHPELDVLRFIAFLQVFAIHALPHDPAVLVRHGLPAIVAVPLARAIQSGGFGVDLFFCLSSYLITALLLREHAATGSIDLKSFYIRRSLRIWPLYFAAVIALLVIAPAFALSPTSPGVVALYACFLGNWVTAFGGLATAASHLWSVSVEEQFYLAWPLVLLLAGVRRIPLVAVGMLIVAGCARAVAIGLEASPDMRWTNTLLRMEPIAVGALIAVWRHQVGVPRWSSRARAVIGGVALLVPALCLMMFRLNSAWDLVIYPVVALADGALLLALLRPTAGALLANPALVHLGKISYGLYVFHAPMLFLLPAPFSAPLPALLATIAAAWLSYDGYERHFLRLKEKFARVPSRPA